MNKLVKVIIGLVSIILLSGCNENEVNSDALRFKEEYESLNSTIRESDGATYQDVEIPEDNPIRYVDATDTLDILKSDKAIIYIGANWCPWCRNAVGVLLDVAKEYDVDTIYYLELDDEKNTFVVKDGLVERTKEGTESYYKLLELLDEYLHDYVITDDEGNEYDTGEKRIYMPMVIGVKNGKVSSYHTGTTSLNEGQTKYDYMTDEQQKELTDIYANIVEKSC